MCSHYQGIKERERYRRHFGVEPPADLGRHDLWPGYTGSFIRRHPHADVGDDAVPELEALPGLFGLVPHWSADTKITKATYNARSETVASKPSFRDAWRKAQHCIIPAEAYFEPDWRSGRTSSTLPERKSMIPLDPDFKAQTTKRAGRGLTVSVVSNPGQQTATSGPVSSRSNRSAFGHRRSAASAGECV